MSRLIPYIEKLHGILDQLEVTNGLDNTISKEKAEEEVLSLLSQVKELGNKVFLVGNGGSASIVSHAQNDLCKANGVRATVLTETGLLTALTNDNGYETAFQQQIDLWGDPGDLLIAVSSSGQSENILRACGSAQRNGLSIVTLSGFSQSNTLRQLGEVNFFVPSNSYGMVELAHSIILHCFTDAMADLLPIQTQAYATKGER